MADPLRFARHDRAIEAIYEYLQERGIALEKDEIVDGVIDGGFRFGKPGLRMGLMRALQSHLIGVAARGSRLREMNGRVGMAEWPEEKFK